MIFYSNTRAKIVGEMGGYPKVNPVVKLQTQFSTKRVHRWRKSWKWRNLNVIGPMLRTKQLLQTTRKDFRQPLKLFYFRSPWTSPSHTLYSGHIHSIQIQIIGKGIVLKDLSFSGKTCIIWKKSTWLTKKRPRCAKPQAFPVGLLCLMPRNVQCILNFVYLKFLQLLMEALY